MKSASLLFNERTTTDGKVEFAKHSIGRHENLVKMLKEIVSWSTKCDGI